METKDVVAELKKIQSAGNEIQGAGNTKVLFRVVLSKKPLKQKHYKNLNHVTKDFSKKKLTDAFFTITMDGTEVGKLNTKKVLDGLYT